MPFSLRMDGQECHVELKDTAIVQETRIDSIMIGNKPGNCIKENEAFYAHSHHMPFSPISMTGERNM